MSNSAPDLPDGEKSVPLVGDPNRQAIGLFKGLDFQIWLTVDAWITLEEDQVLVVEGAEDFDIVKDAAGITTQAKAASQPITLRTGSVIDAIRNFWIAKHRNPGKAIEFRFVTTAAIAAEAGNPFNADAAGLALWMADSERGQTVNTEKLRQFLMTDASASATLAAGLPPGVPSVADFLKKANAAQVHAELIYPIRWLTSHGGVQSTKEAARMRLHAYAERMGLLPSDADRVLPHLFEAVAQKGCKEQRTLNREDFRLLFDEATKPTRREQAALQAMVALAHLQVQNAEAGSEPISLVSGSISLQIPNLPPIWISRDDLVQRIVSALTQTGFAGIHGSTGKGKSTLAKLAIVKVDGDWEWVDYRGMDPGTTDAVLNHVAQKLADRKGSKIVLDNVDVRGPGEAHLCARLAVLTRLLISGGGLLIVTAQRELPARFRSETELPDASFVVVPAFTQEDLELLCRRGGCPEDNSGAHAAVVLLQTGGHPTLANAGVSNRKRNGWRLPSAAEVIQPPRELEDEKQMSRQLLDPLPEAEIELLHRLSLVCGTFRRDQAVAIGEIEPAIARPGDKLDRLVGPWIESAGGDYFRLSSLLSGSGQANWSAARVAQRRREIGRAIVLTGKLTLIEGNEVLLQAVITKEASLAGPFLMQLLLEPFEAFGALSKDLWWLIAFTGEESVFPDNDLVNLFFRQVQFRVASGGKHARAPHFAEMVMSEAEKVALPVMKEYMIAGVTGDILLSMDVLVAPRLLLSCWLKEASLVTSSKHFRSFFEEAQKQRPPGLLIPEQSLSEVMFGFILNRRGGPAYLTEMIQAIDALPASEHQRVLGTLRRMPARLLFFTDRVWTDEPEKASPDWNTVISALRFAWDAGNRWSLPDLVVACARGIAAVQDEYLNDANTALATLSDAVKDTGLDGTLLRAQRGTVYSRQGNHQQAYEQWRSTLQGWRVDDQESAQRALFTFSKCGAAATRLGLWAEAARIFLQGRQVAANAYLETDATSFGVDGAHALWRAVSRRDALEVFGVCLEELERKAGAGEPSGFQMLWKLTEHIIRWCSLDAGALGENYSVEYGGLCSEVKEEERHKQIKERPRAPLPLIWYFLAEAELCSDLGDQVFRKLTGRTDLKRYPGPRAMCAYLSIRRAFKARDFSELPCLIEELAVATTSADAVSRREIALVQPGSPETTPADLQSQFHGLAVEGLSAALFHTFSMGKEWAAQLAIWHDSESRTPSSFGLGGIFKEIEDLMRASNFEIGQIYQGATTDRLPRLLSSFRLATDRERSLEACFVGCLSLVTDNSLVMSIFYVGDCLGDLVRAVWMERLKFPAEFRLARLSVATVQSACAGESKGLQLAARILVAAQTAVATSIPDDMRGRLLQLAAIEPGTSC